MDESLEDRIIEVICEEWEKVAPDTLKSKTVYERLVAEGEHIPDYAMEETLKNLHDGGLIRAPGLHDTEAARKSSGRVITWVSTEGLCE